MNEPAKTYIGADWEGIISDKTLTAVQWQVYLYLSRCSGSKSECFPKQETIAKATNRNRDQVNKAIAGLVAHGYISTQGRGKLRTYKIESTHSCVNGDTHSCVNGDTHSCVNGDTLDRLKVDRLKEKEKEAAVAVANAIASVAIPTARAQSATATATATAANFSCEKGKGRRAATPCFDFSVIGNNGDIINVDRIFTECRKVKADFMPQLFEFGKIISAIAYRRKDTLGQGEEQILNPTAYVKRIINNQTLESKDQANADQLEVQQGGIRRAHPGVFLVSMPDGEYSTYKLEKLFPQPGEEYTWKNIVIHKEQIK